MKKSISFSNYMAASGRHEALLQSLLLGMCAAAVDISCQLATCIFDQMHGANGEQNAQGEKQQHMDVFAEERFISHLKESNACCLVISEEQPDVIHLNCQPGESPPPYVVALDPLDGSSNVAVNVPVGSIFSVYKRPCNDGPVNSGEALRSGVDQLAAGYFLYGTSTVLVYASGNEVNGFTLDLVSKEFILSHPKMRVPLNGTIYAVNDGNFLSFSRGPQNFLRYCRQQADMGDQPFTARYSGSMVSDIHRVLISGGIFLYPEMSIFPQGKLRLAYECFPIAFIMEIAGGMATTGIRRLLEVPMQSIHQRSPIVAGSSNLVITAERFINTSIPSIYELDRQIG
ncbi:fructose-1,6-bisphosphatase I [Mucilaginibacter sp. UYP25]|uniref:class 1 fructose-bisphosphatase n=1 Tax=unclassified Mucilaginibacter TaxID=2617802 RepID=UPI0033988CD5